MPPSAGVGEADAGGGGELQRHISAANEHAEAVATRASEKVFNLLMDQLHSGTMKSTVNKSMFVKSMKRRGLLMDDPRISALVKYLREMDTKGLTELSKEELMEALGATPKERGVVANLMLKVFTNQQVIPKFEMFAKQVERIADETHAAPEANTGHKADYIPGLARALDHYWGVAVCTIDGQRLQYGDVFEKFSIQSTSKPITYCVWLEEHGQEKVAQHVGAEPSGEVFNALKLNKNGRPHNPCINSGWIMSCSLVRRDLDASEKFEYMLRVWDRLWGGKNFGFSNSIYLSEKNSADRNFALSHFMDEQGWFPEGNVIQDTLEFYFQMCSITGDADMMSIMAATLANGGVNPLTGDRVFKADTVKDCLSIIYSCGMYDYSGEFSFRVGLPAKSGVWGAVFTVIPNVMGICTFSPKLDQYGNSTKGVYFYHELTKQFNFHNFDSLASQEERQDPRSADYPRSPRSPRSTWTTPRHDGHGGGGAGAGRVGNMDVDESEGDGDDSAQQEAARMKELQVSMNLLYYASIGNLKKLQDASLAADVDFWRPDYDGRTPLHLWAGAGQLHVVRYLLEECVDIWEDANLNALDRWGYSPLDEAERSEASVKTEVVDMLKKFGARRGQDVQKSQVAAMKFLSGAAGSGGGFRGSAIDPTARRGSASVKVAA